MKIPYVDLKKQYLSQRKEILKVIDKILLIGEYVGGKEVDKFEKNIAKYHNVKYCVSLNSGTDALTLALHAVGVKRGDEVITPPNSFIASAASIVHLGAKPVFVDVLQNQNINANLIEKAITKKTKAIMPVHLTGRVCNMIKIKQISKKYKIPIIEDSAQAIGSKYNNQLSGTFGSVGCFSAHPLKNLNALGDSGFIITNSKRVHDYIKSLSNHGMSKRNEVKFYGHVSRMDNLQAGILNLRLKSLNKVINQRRYNAKIYFENLNSKDLILPYENKLEYNSYHTFVIQTNKRDKLKKFLFNNGVSTSIHYPKPIHLQKASNFLEYQKGVMKETERQSKMILTLPIHQYLTKKEILYICNLINKFYK